MNLKLIFIVARLRGLLASVILLAFSASAFAQPAATPISSVAFDPPNPKVYEPFSVAVTFSKPYCIADAPQFSRVRLTGNALLLSLSHLGDGPCALQRTFVVQGLPDGTFEVTVAVTGTYVETTFNRRETIVVERGTFPLTVDPAAQYNKGAVYTTQFGDAYVLDLAPTGPVRTVFEVNMVTGREDPEFMVYTGVRLGRIGVPSAAVGLWQLRYPSPLKGGFVTTSYAEYTRLITQGFSPMGGEPLFVLPVQNGACPLGASPVYRLFNPKAPAHRYVSSFDTYNVLATNGFVGEGIVFCAPRP